MIKYSELENVFLSQDVEIHEYNIETDEDIDLPYVVYTINSMESFGADGIDFFKTLEISMAFFDETLNFPLQRKIESILENNFTYFDKQVNFDSSVRVYTISYQFTVEDDAIIWSKVWFKLKKLGTMV